MHGIQFIMEDTTGNTRKGLPGAFSSQKKSPKLRWCSLAVTARPSRRKRGRVFLPGFYHHTIFRRRE